MPDNTRDSNPHHIIGKPATTVAGRMRENPIADGFESKTSASTGHDNHESSGTTPTTDRREAPVPLLPLDWASSEEMYDCFRTAFMISAQTSGAKRADRAKVLAEVYGGRTLAECHQMLEIVDCYLLNRTSAALVDTTGSTSVGSGIADEDLSSRLAIGGTGSKNHNANESRVTAASTPKTTKDGNKILTYDSKDIAKDTETVHTSHETGTQGDDSNEVQEVADPMVKDGSSPVAAVEVEVSTSAGMGVSAHGGADGDGDRYGKAHSNEAPEKETNKAHTGHVNKKIHGSSLELDHGDSANCGFEETTKLVSSKEALRAPSVWEKAEEMDTADKTQNSATGSGEQPEEWYEARLRPRQIAPKKQGSEGSGPIQQIAAKQGRKLKESLARPIGTAKTSKSKKRKQEEPEERARTNLPPKEGKGEVRLISNTELTADKQNRSKEGREKYGGHISGDVEEAAEKDTDGQESKQESGESQATFYADRLRPRKPASSKPKPLARRGKPKASKRQGKQARKSLAQPSEQPEQSAEGKQPSKKRKAESPPERARTKVPTTAEFDKAPRRIPPAEMNVWKNMIRKVITNWGNVSPVVIPAGNIHYVKSFIRRIKQGKAQFDVEDEKEQRIECMIQTLADRPDVSGTGAHVKALHKLQEAARKFPSASILGEKDKPESSSKKPRLG